MNLLEASLWVLIILPPLIALISWIPWLIKEGEEGFVWEGRSEHPPKPLSILVPVYNEDEDKLTRCLAQILRQKGEDDQVIVIDDGSTNDATVKVARKLNLDRRDDVKLIMLPENRGKAHALNTGMQCAKGDVLVFMDSNDIPCEGWLNEIASPFSEPTVDLVSGIDFYPDDSPWRLWSKMMEEVGLMKGNLFDGSNFAIRKALMEEIGGFREDTIIEDIEIWMRLQKRRQPIKLVANPRAGATDGVWPTLRSYVSNKVREKVGTFKLLKKTFNKQTILGKFLGLYPFTIYPSMILALLPIVFLMFLAPSTGILLSLLWISMLLFHILRFAIFPITAYRFSGKQKYLKLLFYLPFFVILTYGIHLYALFVEILGVYKPFSERGL